MFEHRRLAGLIVVFLAAWPAPAAARLVIDHVVVRGATKVTERVLTTRMHLYPGDPVDFAVLHAAEQRLIDPLRTSPAAKKLNDVGRMAMITR